jgi:hypothetical protein
MPKDTLGGKGSTEKFYRQGEIRLRSSIIVRSFVVIFPFVFPFVLLFFAGDGIDVGHWATGSSPRGSSVSTTSRTVLTGPHGWRTTVSRAGLWLWGWIIHYDVSPPPSRRWRTKSGRRLCLVESGGVIVCWASERVLDCLCWPRYVCGVFLIATELAVFLVLQVAVRINIVFLLK